MSLVYVDARESACVPIQCRLQRDGRQQLWVCYLLLVSRPLHKFTLTVVKSRFCFCTVVMSLMESNDGKLCPVCLVYNGVSVAQWLRWRLVPSEPGFNSRWHPSHWWRQQGHPSKITPMHQYKSVLVGTFEPLRKGVNSVKFGCFMRTTCVLFNAEVTNNLCCLLQYVNWL